MIGIVLEGILQVIIHVIFEVFFIGTGEIILYVLSMGRRKPVWKRDISEGSLKLGIFIDLSFIIGFVFWLSLALLIINNIFK